MVAAADLKSAVFGREGSSPSSGTKTKCYSIGQKSDEFEANV